jgi:hypothetical protein
MLRAFNCWKLLTMMIAVWLIALIALGLWSLGAWGLHALLVALPNDWSGLGVWVEKLPANPWLDEAATRSPGATSDPVRCRFMC